MEMLYEISKDLLGKLMRTKVKFADGSSMITRIHEFKLVHVPWGKMACVLPVCLCIFMRYIRLGKKKLGCILSVGLMRSINIMFIQKMEMKLYDYVIREPFVAKW